MSELKGYKGKSFDYLNQKDVSVGDSIKVISDLTYEGILMPRYETSEDSHIVLKLKSGYNIGIELSEISDIKKISSPKEIIEQNNVNDEDSSLPKILLLSTGGTIASKVDYRTGAVTPALTAADLNDAVPEITNIANVDTEVLFSEYSENLQPEHWFEIATRLDSLAKSDYMGIIIAHGTDTMHYTSSFLSFALSGFPIPVALVGSQRSSDRPSSDAAVNLIAATKFLTKTNTNGIFVVMHNDSNDDTVVCHKGTRVRKNHTSKRGAFETVGDDPAFIITENNIEKNMNDDFFKNEKYDPKLNLDAKVALVKYHPGYDPRQIKDLADLGFGAIIFEGTGLGHIGKTMYDVIRDAKDQGLFLGMTSQCLDGSVRMTVYDSGRDLLDLGIVPLENMIPETALVKAMWAYGNSTNSEEIESLMLRNIASEF
jgi:glutamyl-tRNA(Gln) amidotransferase subunit D